MIFRDIPHYLILGLSGLSCGFLLAQDPLSIEVVASDEVRLTWEGGFPLLSSFDLSAWDEVEGATSPHTVSVAGVTQQFFNLRLIEPSPLIVDLPEGPFVAATQTIPLEGSVGTALSGTDGLEVRVGSTVAELINVPGGVDRFRFDELLLSGGANSITVTVSNNAGEMETFDFQVNFAPLNPNNVVVNETHAFAALGASGLAIVELATRNRIVIPPPAGSQTVDDVSLDGDLLFTMDSGGGSGFISVYSVADPTAPELRSGPVSFSTNLFSGISAANGRVAVSSGTSDVIVRSYDANGNLSSDFGAIEVSLGHPDVIVAPDGNRAVISSDFRGTVNGQGFGITLINTATNNLQLVRRRGLPGATFSQGTQQPANFPIESAISGETLLVAHGGGLSLLDLNLTQATRTLNLGFQAINVDIQGDTAFVVGQNEGTDPFLARVDFQSASPQVQVENLATTGEATSVAVNEDFIVVAANDEGLLVLER